MQRIRDIFNIANFFNDRGGVGGEGAEGWQVPWSGKAYETLSHEIQKGELSPLPDSARHNKLVDPNPEQFG